MKTVAVRNKPNFRFIITDTAVYVFSQQNKRHCMTFNAYNSRGYNGFNYFARTIKQSRKTQYDNINDIFALANRMRIRGCAGGYMKYDHRQW